MLKAYLQRLFADESGTPALVRRLLSEQAWSQRRRYALAFGLMVVAAGATALCAYLIGHVINAAYVDKNLPGIFWLAMGTAGLFMLKALATYGSSLTLASRSAHLGEPVTSTSRTVFSSGRVASTTGMTDSWVSSTLMPASLA